MGKCFYCNKWAGFFKKYHEECAENYLIKKKKAEAAETESKLVALNTITEILNAKIDKNLLPSLLEFSNYGLVPMLKNEVLFYCENSAHLYQTKKKVSYIGGSQGVSLRIAKGISYRVGAFKGDRVITEEQEYICSGDFLFSSAGIYFKGSSKSLRIRYNKIISLECFENGILILKDGESALPIFISFKNEEVLKKIYELITRVISD